MKKMNTLYSNLCLLFLVCKWPSDWETWLKTMWLRFETQQSC